MTCNFGYKYRLYKIVEINDPMNSLVAILKILVFWNLLDVICGIGVWRTSIWGRSRSFFSIPPIFSLISDISLGSS